MFFILFFLLSSMLTNGAQGSQRTGDPKPTPSPARQGVQSPLPAPTGHVNDYAHALNDDTREQLEQALTELKNRSKIEFAVALVNNTGGKPIVTNVYDHNFTTLDKQPPGPDYEISFPFQLQRVQRGARPGRAPTRPCAGGGAPTRRFLKSSAAAREAGLQALRWRCFRSAPAERTSVWLVSA
jgi:hypothetical protein